MILSISESICQMCLNILYSPFVFYSLFLSYLFPLHDLTLQKGDSEMAVRTVLSVCRKQFFWIICTKFFFGSSLGLRVSMKNIVDLNICRKTFVWCTVICDKDNIVYCFCHLVRSSQIYYYSKALFKSKALSSKFAVTSVKLFYMKVVIDKVCKTSVYV